MPYSNLLRGRSSATGQIYLATAATFRRERVFADFDLARIVARELEILGRERHWEPIAWVVMPDHLHALVRLLGATLPGAMRLLKGRTSRTIRATRLRDQPIWQRGYHEHAIRRDEDLKVVARYVCANPVRGGLVRSLRDYPFWNCCWL
jgi:REP element-mobilizing transposase RayT